MAPKRAARTNKRPIGNEGWEITPISDDEHAEKGNNSHTSSKKRAKKRHTDTSGPLAQKAQSLAQALEQEFNELDVEENGRFKADSDELTLLCSFAWDELGITQTDTENYIIPSANTYARTKCRGSMTLEQFQAFFLEAASSLDAQKRAESLVELAKKSESKGDLEGARRIYEQALECYPGHVEAALNLSQVIHSEARTQGDINETEKYLRVALGTYLTNPLQPGPTCSKDDATRNIAQTRLILLLCQEGRDKEAREYLKRFGFQFRLSRDVLHYPLPGEPIPLKPGDNLVQAVDNVLSAKMLNHMQRAYGHGSRFWSEHNYNSEYNYCPTPYFSYLHALSGEPQSALDVIIRHVQSVAVNHFPGVKDAKMAEWWAHCRPHPSGHQLHFDSDDEGRNGIRNPIISCVVYLTGTGVGGPTMVTDQHLIDKRLAHEGWIVHPKVNRLVMFDGKVLHGVIPGRSFLPQYMGDGGTGDEGGENDGRNRRITFMVAFWKDIQERPRVDGKPGSAQAYPLPGTIPEYTWPDMHVLDSSTKWDEGWRRDELVRVPAAYLPRVWESVDESHGPAGDGKINYLPHYDVCFQGF